MLYKFEGDQSPSMKKCYFMLWAVFAGTGERAWFPSKGTKEKGEFLLSKLARKKIGKEFTTAVLIDRRTNTRVRIWTLDEGEQAYTTYEATKSSRMAKKRTPSLLRMSVKVAHWTNEYKTLKAAGKQPFVNFFSSKADLITGEVGIHQALDNFLDILGGKYWVHRYEYANIRYKSEKKVVAKIGKDIVPVILDEKFYNLLENT